MAIRRPPLAQNTVTVTVTVTVTPSSILADFVEEDGDRCDVVARRVQRVLHQLLRRVLFPQVRSHRYLRRLVCRDHVPQTVRSQYKPEKLPLLRGHAHRGLSQQAERLQVLPPESATVLQLHRALAQQLSLLEVPPPDERLVLVIM